MDEADLLDNIGDFHYGGRQGLLLQALHRLSQEATALRGKAQRGRMHALHGTSMLRRGPP